MRTHKIIIEVSTEDDVDANTAGHSIFETLCEQADDDIIFSVDGYEVRRP